MTDKSAAPTAKFKAHAARFRYLYLAACIVFAGILLYVCQLPYETLVRAKYPSISDLFDAMNHFLAFTFFNFLLFTSVVGFFGVSGRVKQGPAGGAGMVSKWSVFFFTLLAASWGALCESIQLLRETRSFQLIDVAANTLPAGLLLYALARMRYTVQNESREENNRT